MRLKLILTCCLFLVLTPFVYSQKSAPKIKGNLSLQTDIITQHWESRFYNEEPNLIALEYYNKKKDKFYGISYFRNSFYQSSWYLYTGFIYPLYQKQKFSLRAKITYGIVHGYEEEDGKYTGFINRLGTFPAILPTIGINYNNFIIELIPLANEGFMFTTGIRF